MSDKVSLAAMARLSCLELSTEESQRLEKSLNEILDAFDELQSVDTQGVEPLFNINENNVGLRADRPHRLISREELLRSAPNVSEDSYRVKKVVTKE